jgi:cytochrome c553
MRSRLGDDIDDFCVKCKRVMNHLVVSLMNDEPAKVRCRTCHGDHDFRHEQAPPPKIDARKAALIQQALEKAAAPEVAESAMMAAAPEAAEAVPVPAAAPARKNAKAK